jgi:hypothetical protein
MSRLRRREDTGQTSLVGQLDWRPEARTDSERLRALPPVVDPRIDEIERRVRHLEMEARAIVRSIPWRDVVGGSWQLRRHVLRGGRADLLRHIAGALLIVRAPHLTNARRVRLLDAFDACFAPDRPDPDGALRFSAVVRDLARVDPPTVAAIGHRDRWTCALCGLPVLRRAPSWIRTHPLRASIDHVVPISRGGPDAPANARLAHGYCNSVRHDDTEDRRASLERRHTRPLEARVLTAVLEWEREYAGDHLANMRRWLQDEDRRLRKARAPDSTLLLKLRRDVAAEEARFARAGPPWDRPDWYSALLMRAAERRSSRRQAPGQVEQHDAGGDAQVQRVGEPCHGDADQPGAEAQLPVGQAAPLLAEEDDRRPGDGQAGQVHPAPRRGPDHLAAVPGRPGRQLGVPGPHQAETEDPAHAGPDNVRVEGVGEALQQDHAGRSGRLGRAQQRPQVAR